MSEEEIYYNDFDPNTDCSCYLEAEYDLVKNDNLTGIVGYYRLKNILRHPNKLCREHSMNKEEERLTNIINLARKTGPTGFMDAIIRAVDKETKCGGCGKILGPKDVCSLCLVKSWREEKKWRI